MKHGTEQILHAESIRREAIAFKEYEIGLQYCEETGEWHNGYFGSTTSELYDQYLKSKSVEPTPEVMANVTEAKETEPNQLRQLLIDRGTDFHENYHLNLRAKGKYGMGNVLRDLVKFMANLAVSINQTPKPVTPCNGLKSSAEILSELSGYEVKELKERQTEPIIQPIDALEAMQLYIEQFNQQKGTK